MPQYCLGQFQKEHFVWNLDIIQYFKAGFGENLSIVYRKKYDLMAVIPILNAPYSRKVISWLDQHFCCKEMPQYCLGQFQKEHFVWNLDIIEYFKAGYGENLSNMYRKNMI